MRESRPRALAQARLVRLSKQGFVTSRSVSLLPWIGLSPPRLNLPYDSSQIRYRSVDFMTTIGAKDTLITYPE